MLRKRELFVPSPQTHLLQHEERVLLILDGAFDLEARLDLAQELVREAVAEDIA